MTDGYTEAGRKKLEADWAAAKKFASDWAGMRQDKYISANRVCALALAALKNRNWQPETDQEWIEYIAEYRDRLDEQPCQ